MSQFRLNSMDRFRGLTVALRKEVRASAIDELKASAQQLADQMRAAAPQGPTGNLKQSIRVVPGKKETQVRIVAGGPLTTVMRPGHAYDYARAVEFGTEQTGAQPFFYPSYRLRKKKIRSKLKRRITQAIKRRSAV